MISPRRSDAIGYRRWNHGDADNGFWSSHSYSVASGPPHFFRHIRNPVPPRAGDRRIACLPLSERPHR